MSLSNFFLYLINLLLTPFTQGFFSKSVNNKNIKKTLKLYPESKFIKIRFWDAPFLEVEKLIPLKAKILDLGCGEGIFTNFLGISSPQRAITGIEINQDRLSQADRGVSNVSFKKGDATKVLLFNYDVVVMFHLLHHLTSFNQQEDL